MASDTVSIQVEGRPVTADSSSSIIEAIWASGYPLVTNVGCLGQGVCGSCWAFSASQVMSSAVWMQTGKYLSLSEQQVMDCSWGYGENHACDGGDPDLGVQV